MSTASRRSIVNSSAQNQQKEMTAEEKQAEYIRNYQEEHTQLLSVRFNNVNDKDLLDVLEGKVKGGEVKRLMRLGILYEKENPDVSESD